MKNRILSSFLPAISVLGLAGSPASAAISVITEFDDAANSETTGTFSFSTIPSNVSGDLAESGTVSLVGSLEGGSLANLTNGVAQTSLAGNIGQSTTPKDNEDTRFVFDLGSLQEVARFNSYSSNSGNRAAQNYNLFAATGLEVGFSSNPALGTAPTTTGYTLLTTVSTATTANGQWGASVFEDTTGVIGTYRYFLMETLQAGNSAGQRTNYGEVDIIAVPEPSTALLLLPAGLLAFRRRRTV